jgi:hypothetical protein
MGSSRTLICATKFLCRRRSRNAGFARAVNWIPAWMPYSRAANAVLSVRSLSVCVMVSLYSRSGSELRYA